MDTFLTPIEKPAGLMMKLIFAMTRRQVGKVLTPLKVFTARLPLPFGQFYGKVSRLDKTLLLSAEMAALVRQQVARINVCSFCIDVGRWASIKASMNQAKLDALPARSRKPAKGGLNARASDAQQDGRGGRRI